MCDLKVETGSEIKEVVVENRDSCKENTDKKEENSPDVDTEFSDKTLNSWDLKRDSKRLGDEKWDPEVLLTLIERRQPTFDKTKCCERLL